MRISDWSSDVCSSDLGDGTPVRLGFALANEFSDHVTERGNYLWLAHSKLRPAALGPELLTGTLPDHVEGASSIVRDGKTIWEKPFVSGEIGRASCRDRGCQSVSTSAFAVS